MGAPDDSRSLELLDEICCLARGEYEMAVRSKPIDAETLELLVRATTRLNALHNGHAPRFSFITDAQMEALPMPAWAIAGIYPVGGLVVVFGPSGIGKSFLLLDWALAHATGQPWLGRGVQRGPVVYVAAEGSAGLGSRIRAWKRAHQVEGVAGVHFLTQPVALMESRVVDQLLQSIEALQVRPCAIVFDTLARNMIGGDENSAQDMGTFVAGADRIRQHTGAAVIIVHHTGRNGEHERGSTALAAAADAVVSLKAKDDLLELACTKMKDGPSFEPIALQLHPEADSCVVITPLEGLEQSPSLLTTLERQTLQSLHTDFLEDGASATQWAASSKLSNGSFYRLRTSLYKKGFVQLSKPGRGGRYTLSDKGREAFTPLTPTHSTRSIGASPSITPPTIPPLYKGGMWSEDQELELEAEHEQLKARGVL